MKRSQVLNGLTILQGKKIRKGFTKNNFSFSFSPASKIADIQDQNFLGVSRLTGSGSGSDPREEEAKTDPFPIYPFFSILND